MWRFVPEMWQNVKIMTVRHFMWSLEIHFVFVGFVFLESGLRQEVYLSLTCLVGTLILRNSASLHNTGHGAWIRVKLGPWVFVCQADKKQRKEKKTFHVWIELKKKLDRNKKQTNVPRHVRAETLPPHTHKKQLIPRKYLCACTFLFCEI